MTISSWTQKELMHKLFYPLLGKQWPLGVELPPFLEKKQGTMSLWGLEGGGPWFWEREWSFGN